MIELNASNEQLQASKNEVAESSSKGQLETDNASLKKSTEALGAEIAALRLENEAAKTQLLTAPANRML